MRKRRTGIFGLACKLVGIGWINKRFYSRERELYSKSCDKLEWKEYVEEYIYKHIYLYMYVCITESLCCMAEINTML